MKYVLLFVETEQFEKDLEAKSQADRDRAFELVYKWMADHADKIRGGSKLQLASTATTVRLDAGSEPVITDGPFVEIKEALGGYLFFEADNLDAAIELASRIPAARMGGAIEVRPLVER